MLSHPMTGDWVIRSERIPWQFVPRHQRKGYLDRDFCLNGRWYRPIWSGADEVGLIRYGMMIDKENVQ